jgi:hypothetical protein
MTRKRNGEPGAAVADPRPTDPPAETADRNRPVHSIRLRNVRASVWANQTEQGVFYSVKITRFYKDAEGNWKNSDGFGRDDLLLVAKAADMAHTWICELLQTTQQDVPF